MTRRTSVALLALLLAPAWLLGVPGASESATGAKGRGGSRAPRVRLSALRTHGARRHRRLTDGSPCAGADARPTRANLTTVQATIMCLVNRERRLSRLAPLRPNRQLSAIAAKQAADMVAGGYFGDNSLSGQTALERIAASPYAWHSRALSTGQNIAWGVGRLATPAAAVAGWMRSSAHRRIMLAPAYRDGGAGVAPSAPGRRPVPGGTYVLELATRVN